MSPIFSAVYFALMKLVAVTGLNYEEVNIIVFYVIVPAILFALIDKILRKPVSTVIFAVIVTVAFFRISDFTVFSDWLFRASVDFLMLFEKVGVSYDMASVVICVILPLILFVILFAFAFPAFTRRRIPNLAGILKIREARS